MPGQGYAIELPCTEEERTVLGASLSSFGETMLDIYVNDSAFWRNVPVGAWHYKLGGYQMLEKWLSYWEREVLGRSLTPAKVQYFAETTRRIAAICVWVHG